MPSQKHTYIIISLFIITLFPFAKLQARTNDYFASDSTRVDYLSKNGSTVGDSIINYGKLFLNTPYRYGSTGVSSFDCSGFTSYVYRNFGYDLGRSSVDQSRQFNQVDKNELKAGDLVFFSGRHRSKNVGHVGIVVSAGNGEFNFIHAAVHNGVTISNSKEAYYTKRFLKASRVIGATPILTAVHKFFTKTFSNDEPATKQTSAKTQVQNFAANQPQAALQTTNPVKKTRKIPAEYHTVKSGETLSSIALQYGLTIAELKKKNKIKGNKLKLKQKIKVKDEETVVETINQPTTNAPQIAESKNTSGKADAQKSNTEASSKSGDISHKVKKGETLYSIARQYNLSVDELKKINDIPNGKIRPGQELKVAQQQTDHQTKNTEVAKAETSQKLATHKVASGESLYSIAKMYGITVDELKRINNIPTGKIRPGQELKLSDDGDKNKNAVAEKAENKPSTKNETAANANTVNYKVKKGESLITIANDNNITVDELKKLNNLSDSKIKAGQELKLTQSAGKSKNTKNHTESKTIEHKVKSGESYYSIAKDYGCTVDDLKEWNKKTGTKIKPGDKIVVHPNAN